MILQRLTEYYDRILQDPCLAPNLPRPGYSRQKISFCVVLTSDGRLQQFQSLLDSAGSRKPVPRKLFVPGETKPSGSGLNPCFLWDNAAYMLGFLPQNRQKNSPKELERTRKCFHAFRERHLSIENQISSPAFRAVCQFLRNWSPERSAEYEQELSEITSSFGVFRIAGEQRFVHEDPAVIAWWQDNAERWHKRKRAGDAPLGICLVTGERAPIARLHEPIRGVRGAQSTGGRLVSFNDPAYESLGHKQSYNAPVSRAVVFKYANALNFLLGQQERRIFLGDATVVFWAERPSSLEEYFSDLFNEAPPASPDAPAEDERKVRQIRLFLSQLQQGYAASHATPEDETRFFVLGLSPNRSRLSVRFWADSTVGEMKQRLSQHLQDIQLVGGPPHGLPLTIGNIVRATGRAKFDPKGRLLGYDDNSVSPLLAGAIARAVLTGGPYPRALLSAMVGRLRSDGYIGYARVAAIKACLTRNSRLSGNPKEVPVSLDRNRTEPAYLIGRLFALLEKAQEDSVGGELNATIKDRYFSSASATPGFVFPRLIRLSQHHLAKLDRPKKVSYEKLIGEVMDKLDGFPRQFSLEDQGLFAVGYFHQRQSLFTKKEKNPTEGEAA